MFRTLRSLVRLVASCSLCLAVAVPAFAEDSPALRKRIEQSNKMKMIGLGYQFYMDVEKTLPPRETKLENAPEGKRGLSWRVHILPYIEHLALYEEFHLDEPWDSERNKALIPKMPKLYKSIDADVPEGKTVFLQPLYERSIAAFHAKGERGMTDSPDDTVLFLEAAPSKAVIWTQPDDLEIDLDAIAQQVGHPDAKSFFVCMVNDAVRPVARDIDRETFRSLIQANDGGKIDWATLKRE